MAPGGSSISKEIVESTATNVEWRSSPSLKTATSLRGSPRPPLNDGVHELLDCPICMNLMYPPIYQCPNGHTICSNCKTRVPKVCPSCRYELGNIRCLALEKVAESLELPCRFKILGCQDIFPYYGKLKHEKNCLYRPFHCPYAGADCSVAGDIPHLIEHLRDDHKVDMHDGSTFNHRYVKSNPQEVSNATWMLTIFNCYGRQFCLHFEAFQLGTAPVYMAFLRFMGGEEEARQFSYSLEVGGNGRRLVWQGIPRSIRDSHRKVRESQDGLIVQRDLALFFSGGDGRELKLKVAGRVWRNTADVVQVGTEFETLSSMHDSVNKILLGNKADMDESKRVVPTAKGQALADEYGIKFFETSANTNLNVVQVFFSIARDIKQRLVDTDSKAEPSTIKINQPDQAGGAADNAQKSACCG